MKKIFLILICLCFSVSLFAQKNRIIDEAGLLTAAEIAELEKRAEEIAAKFNFDLVIVTKTSIDGADIEDYAVEYLDSTYGLEKDREGCLLLQVTEHRDYVIITSEKAKREILNSMADDKLVKNVVSYLRMNNYAEAYRAFFNTWEEFLTLKEKGRSYNFFHVYHIQSLIAVWIFAIALGFACLSYWKGQMNTIIHAKEADNYMASAGLAISQKKDRFLYSNVAKIPRVDKAALAKGVMRTASSGRSYSSRRGKY